MDTCRWSLAVILWLVGGTAAGAGMPPSSVQLVGGLPPGLKWDKDEMFLQFVSTDDLIARKPPSLVAGDRVEIYLTPAQAPMAPWSDARKVPGRVAGRPVTWIVTQRFAQPSTTWLQYDTTVYSKVYGGPGWDFDVGVRVFATTKQNAVIFLRSLTELTVKE